MRIVVEHPFAWMKQRGWGRARYRGVSRNGFDFALNLLAWNLHRARDLLLAQRRWRPRERDRRAGSARVRGVCEWTSRRGSTPDGRFANSAIRVRRKLACRGGYSEAP